MIFLSIALDQYDVLEEIRRQVQSGCSQYVVLRHVSHPKYVDESTEISYEINERGLHDLIRFLSWSGTTMRDGVVRWWK